MKHYKYLYKFSFLSCLVLFTCANTSAVWPNCALCQEPDFYKCELLFLWTLQNWLGEGGSLFNYIKAVLQVTPTLRYVERKKAYELLDREIKTFREIGCLVVNCILLAQNRDQ